MSTEKTSPEKSSGSGLLDAARRTLADAVKVSLDLFKVMVPVIIIVKVLREIGAIEYLAAPLGPLMRLVGLPGDMGLVWAAAMLNNIYAGMAVFAQLAPDAHLTQAQATVVCLMMLIAHSLPVELKIAERAGARLLGQGVIRIGSAIVAGAIMNRVYLALDWLQQPNELLWSPAAGPVGLADWAVGEVRNLFWIFCIILGLMIMMRVLNFLRVTEFITRLLAPLLRVMGVGREASTITVFGMILGLSYGSGLIFHEIKSGRVRGMDVFYSMSLMGIAHSLIEDTLLMLALGGHPSGVLWARLIYSLIFMAVLARVLGRCGPDFAERRLIRPARV